MELSKRQSIEASLPVHPEGQYTPAETYALLGTKEALEAFVGEQYAKLPQTVVLRVADTTPPSLVVHDPVRGYVKEGCLMQQTLMQLLTMVRGAVRGVEADHFEEDDSLDQSMINKLGKLSDTANKVDEPRLKRALIEHLQSTPANVVSLDAQSGVLNLAGPKVHEYNRAAGTLELVTRDPVRHHVHRTTGVDCEWFKGTLSDEKQAQYAAFESQKLKRWLIK